MLHILWLIIKFILIILGIAGALLLSVLLLLLFCPVRYLIQLSLIHISEPTRRTRIAY